MRNSIIITLLICLSQYTLAQTFTYESADSITYAQYMSNDYRSLQETGRLVLKEGIDFYYLRMRLGISYYEKKNYETALKHFRKANTMNPADTIAQEYLYYSLLFTGRKDDAYSLAKTLSQSLQQKIGFKKFELKDVASTVEQINLTEGNMLSNNIAKNQDADFRQGAAYAENTLQGNTLFGSVYLKNKITPRLRLHNGFTYFNTQLLGIVQSFFQLSKKEYSDNTWQYNVAADYNFKFGLKTGAAFGYYKERSSHLSSKVDTAHFRPLFFDEVFEHTAYTGSVYLNYRFHRFEFLLSGSVGNLSDVKQWQGDLGLVYYPLGNQNFYSVSSASYLKNDSTGNFIFSQKFGGKIYKSLWFEANGSYGNMHNYIKSYGFETYNTLEPVLYSAGASLKFYYKKMCIMPSYNFQQRESSYMKRIDLNNEQIIKSKYNNHLITLSLQWSF